MLTSEARLIRCADNYRPSLPPHPPPDSDLYFFSHEYMWIIIQQDLQGQGGISAYVRLTEGRCVVLVN
jgi:hypothetical protein